MKHVFFFNKQSTYCDNYKFNSFILKNKKSPIFFIKFKNSLIILKNFFSIFLKDGKKFSIKINFFFFFFNFFQIQLQSSLNKIYFYKLELQSILQNNNFLFNFLNLLQWYLNYFFFIFSIKIIKKKSNTKLNKFQELNYKTTYISKPKRYSIFFKWLKLEFTHQNTKSKQIKIETIMYDLFLNFKQSKLYKYKLHLYKKLLAS